jgi:hypothetical protein
MSNRWLDRVDLPPAGHYLLAVSNNPGSVVLMHLLGTTETDYDWHLQVAYLHDGNAQAERLMRGMSRVYGLPFQSSAENAHDKFLVETLERSIANTIVAAEHHELPAGTPVLVPLAGLGDDDLREYIETYRLPVAESTATKPKQPKPKFGTTIEHHPKS